MKIISYRFSPDVTGLKVRCSCGHEFYTDPFYHDVVCPKCLTRKNKAAMHNTYSVSLHNTYSELQLLTT